MFVIVVRVDTFVCVLRYPLMYLDVEYRRLRARSGKAFSSGFWAKKPGPEKKNLVRSGTSKTA